MSKLTKALTAAAGNAGESLYVEDVFSTYLYDGNSSTQTITNGIDLAGEGGLVWLKSRSSGANYYDNVFCDTERGSTKYLASSGLLATAGEQTQTQSPRDITSFNSNGFSLGIDNTFFKNVSGQTFASWTFRKAEKFFDVVTYTGNGTSTNNIAHNLGAVPAFVIIKRTDVAQEWVCAHVNLSNLQANYDLHLNDTGAASQQGYASFQWNDASINVKKVTDTLANANASGGTYVAYLFASDAGGFGDDGSESIIKCGSYTGNGAVGNEVNLGFEPQWLMVKRTDSTSDWGMFDVMRGIATGGNDARLRAQGSDAENEFNYVDVTSTGFSLSYAGSDMNASGGNYIYIAIRRPMKTPESGTEVFTPIAKNSTTPTTDWAVGFSADMFLEGFRTFAGVGQRINTRLTGGSAYLETWRANSEFNGFGGAWDEQDSYSNATGGVTPLVGWFFKRATGFFDVVAYTGTGVARNITHNLGVTPELMIVKSRSSVEDWMVYHKDLDINGDSSPETDYIFLNGAANGGDEVSVWNDTAPTDSVFTVGTNSGTNGNTKTYIAYLFSTLEGVSKVGGYTGTAATLPIDCGFSTGARFILIKRQGTGGWYVWDTARGIIAGSEPYLQLNSTAAEVSADYIQPNSSGFTVTSSAPAELNASGGKYIFLAIA